MKMEKQEDDPQQPTSDSKFRTCRWCNYDANPLTNELCNVCGYPLDPKKFQNPSWWNPLSTGSVVRLLGLSALLLLAGGASYWLFKNQPSPSDSVGSIPAAEISRSADIRLYRTMQEVPNVPKGLFQYSSALSFAAITAHGMNERIQQTHPAFQIRYTEPRYGHAGSTPAIRMLIDGEVSIAQSARPLEDEELNRARSRQIVLDQIPIAIDAIIFYVHPEVSIPGLSLSQAQDIYAGKITNWKEVGGPNLPIVPMSLDPKAVSSPKIALGDIADHMGRQVRIITNHTDGVRRVANTPGAISFSGGSDVTRQKMVRVLSIARGSSNQYVSPLTTTGEVNKSAFRDGSYPITRRLFIIIRRNGSFDEQAGVAYANLFLSGEGQQIIERAGFVPLY